MIRGNREPEQSQLAVEYNHSKRHVGVTNTEHYNEYVLVGFHITLSDAIGRSHATSPLSNGSNLCTYESQINLNSFPIHFLIVFDRSFASL